MMRKPFRYKRFWLLARLLGLAAGLCSGAAFARPVPQEPPDFEGRSITAIRILAGDGRVLQENPAQLNLKAGAAYDSLALRDCLRELYATGRYAEIRAEAVADGDGVRVDFVVSESLFFNLVRVAGLPNERLENRAQSVLQLNLGDTFTPDKVEQALVRLGDSLRDEGFYEAKSSYELSPKPETRQMDVRVLVATGPRARITAIALTNRTPFPDKQVLGKSRLRAGRTVSPARLERAGTRLRSFLSKKGHHSARVALRRGDYNPQSHSLPLEMEVLAGPRVHVEVTGVGISDSTLRQLVPIYQEGSVDEDLLQEGRRNLRAYLEREGYFDAAVSFSQREDTEKGQRVITYAVERGPRRKLMAVEFQGNRYFSNSLLRERLSMQPAAFLDRGRFSRRLLADDEASLRELYRTNGFQNPVVRGEIIQNHQGKEENLLVRFTVSEGVQTRVADLRIEGAQALDAETLQGVVGSTPGQPYSEYNLASDRDNILATYFNEGFPEARFESRADPSAEPNRMNLTYRVAEGPQTRIQKVVIAGNEFTRTGVIERELLTEPPEPLRQGDVVESQRQLYNLGIFSRVQIAPQNPAGTERDKTLVVLVDEARRYTIAYGGGIEFQRLGSGGDPVSGAFRASPRGLFEISKNNFAGRAHTISFKARASTLQGRALASYAAPYFLGRPKVNFLFTALADKTRDVRTFTSQRFEVGAQIEQRASRVTSFLYRYSFRKVLVDASSLRIDPQQVPLFSQPTRISGFGGTWIRDRRDNPAEAQKGDFNTADFSYASKSLGSSASFFRLFVQNSTFHRVLRNLVFARSTRFGVQEPTSGTAVVEIPLPERFFSGGGNSLRGFGLNQAGPRDDQTGFPLGGLALLVFNNELRFPMKLPKLGNKAGGAFFYDAGNAFRRVNQITLRATPVSPTSLNYFSHTIGFGFRYGTPIGPVRLDLGYLLNPARFEFCEPSSAPDLARCPAGGQAPVLKRLPRFQFFFSIGSIF